jgi:hypothetical protein
LAVLLLIQLKLILNVNYSVSVIINKAQNNYIELETGFLI